MNFEAAVRLMKKGRKVTRPEFGGEHIYIDEDEAIVSNKVEKSNVLMTLESYEATNWVGINEKKRFEVNQTIDGIQRYKALIEGEEELIKLFKRKTLINKNCFGRSQEMIIKIELVKEVD